jgi:pyroglutamyl-peptidase
VTGFGPFDIDAFPEENPTTVLAETLVEYLQLLHHQHSGLTDSCIIQTLVMETSIQGVQTAMDQIYDQLITASQQDDDGNGNKNTSTMPVILLHLGVNRTGTHFQIESCAYNETQFRIPDQRGNQPQNESIYLEDPLGCAVPTSVRVDDLLQTILHGQKHDKKHHPKPCVSISDDPGRFVCNYAYCYSLRKFKDMEQVQCLFVHVPPFHICPQTEQLELLAAVLQALKQQVEKQS